MDGMAVKPTGHVDRDFLAMMVRATRAPSSFVSTSAES
jgi:hypothetical protein